MVYSNVLAVALISASSLLANADTWSCDIAIHGLGPNMSGLWMYKSGEYLPGDNRNRYEQYEPMPPKAINPSLEFNMAKGYYKKYTSSDAWLIVNYRISKYGSTSDDAEILARCASPACVKTTDISKLPADTQWEVAANKCSCGEKSCDVAACGFKPVSAHVSIGCCEETPDVQKCDSWTSADCAKLAPSILHGNHCEDSGCCTMHHPKWWQAECSKAYIPKGFRCKASKAQGLAASKTSSGTLIV